MSNARDEVPEGYGIEVRCISDINNRIRKPHLGGVAPKGKYIFYKRCKMKKIKIIIKQKEKQLVGELNP